MLPWKQVGFGLTLISVNWGLNNLQTFNSRRLSERKLFENINKVSGFDFALRI